jgi:hypothetical protein
MGGEGGLVVQQVKAALLSGLSVVNVLPEGQ